MSDVITIINEQLKLKNLRFTQKPILIGGMAMGYYGIRKSGLDVDFVICDKDYQRIVNEYPGNAKDIWGDLGVVIEPFEVWRSIMLLDYNVFQKDAVDTGDILVVSLDRLLLMRAFLMDSSTTKHREDLKLMIDFLQNSLKNKSFEDNQTTHLESYKKMGGTVLGGKYLEG